MKDFEMKPDADNRAKRRKTAAAALGISAAMLAGNIHAENSVRTAGVPMPVSRPLNTLLVRSLVESNLKNKFEYSFVNDYHLIISEGGRAIEFTADGCDPTNKIAYEWIADPAYSAQADKDKLTAAEIGMITNFSFGGWNIFTIDVVDDRSLKQKLGIYIIILSNR